MSKHNDKPLNFNRAMFGSMGSNPSINALTNANAMAAQQMPQMPQMPQQPPVNPVVGVYGRPDMRAQMMGVGSTVSPVMKHDELDQQLKDLEAIKQELIEKFGPDSDPVYEQKSLIMDKKREIEAAKEEHKNK